MKVIPFSSNHVIIKNDDGSELFQSYSSIICKTMKGGQVILDSNTWNYSNTTSKNRSKYLGENIKETRKKIASGEYLLQNLNQ